MSERRKDCKGETKPSTPARTLPPAALGWTQVHEGRSGRHNTRPASWAVRGVGRAVAWERGVSEEVVPEGGVSEGWGHRALRLREGGA